MQLVEATNVAMLIATYNMEFAGRMDRRVTIREGRVEELEWPRLAPEDVLSSAPPALCHPPLVPADAGTQLLPSDKAFSIVPGSPLSRE